MFFRRQNSSLLKGSIIAVALGSTLILNACTNATSQAGRVSYFTEGVITDVELISLDLNQHNNTHSAVVGGAIGAAGGQIIGRDTKGTLIGAGVGALLGLAASSVADRTSEGARLTVNTNQGLILVDQPFSCDFKKGAKIRMINQGNSTVQVQVLVNGSYRTVQTNDDSSKCPLS